MRIEHMALWVKDLEKSKHFYIVYFKATAGIKYHNPTKNFTSYFLTFPDGGGRLELMHHPEVTQPERVLYRAGYVHLSISLGSKDDVDQLTDRMRSDGLHIVGEPRVTGDGYYESVVTDHEGNFIELTV